MATVIQTSRRPFLLPTHSTLFVYFLYLCSGASRKRSQRHDSGMCNVIALHDDPRRGYLLGSYAHNISLTTPHFLSLFRLRRPRRM